MNPQDKTISDLAYEQHRIDQLRRMAKLSFREKLQWLDEAHKMVLHMQKKKDEKNDRK